ncbi:unnamed protein product [Mycena citricolor]|uniref:DUF6535 domain-containing protein n=1 Tax=Mycena citricolor TaxID=2018698 RepID=A0AAD2GWL9_9AGAR|nr:unnamed protein product [Mycena citricolor]
MTDTTTAPPVETPVPPPPPPSNNAPPKRKSGKRRAEEGLVADKSGAGWKPVVWPMVAEAVNKVGGPGGAKTTQCTAYFLASAVTAVLFLAPSSIIFPWHHLSSTTVYTFCETQADMSGDITGSQWERTLLRALEEQTSILRRFEARQAGDTGELCRPFIVTTPSLRAIIIDPSSQPIPQVSATSNSTWGAMLRTAIGDTIQPQVDRWRSGIDALLVFIGLFSAVVTTFLVGSLPSLQQSDTARTNELLANLTNIIIQLNSGTQASSLIFPSATLFTPDEVNIRVNSYWTISLVLSLSLAALAVACRGILNQVTLSRRKQTTEKLIEIQNRWKAADIVLGPAVDMLPLFLVFPVVLFVLGLIDTVVAAGTALHIAPIPLFAAVAISLSCVTAVLAFFAKTILHPGLRPSEWPFQSQLTTAWHMVFPPEQPVIGEGDHAAQVIKQVYHETVQTIYDDQALDKAASCVSSHIGHYEVKTGLLFPGLQVWETEVKTLAHLLLPEASLRCNSTAAHVIIENWSLFGQFSEELPYSDFPPQMTLMEPLTEAARRSLRTLPKKNLWFSIYLKAIAVICRNYHPHHPPVPCLIGANPRIRSPEVDYLLRGVLFDHLRHVQPESAWTADEVNLFVPDHIDTSNVLRFIFSLRDPDEVVILASLLMRAKTPGQVLSIAVQPEFCTDSTVYSHLVASWVLQAFQSLPEPLRNLPAERKSTLKQLCFFCIRTTKEMHWAALYTHHLRVLESALSSLPAQSGILDRLMQEAGLEKTTFPPRISAAPPHRSAIRSSSTLPPEAIPFPSPIRRLKSFVASPAGHNALWIPPPASESDESTADNFQDILGMYTVPE